jgi:hypothetical protein
MRSLTGVALLCLAISVNACSNHPLGSGNSGGADMKGGGTGGVAQGGGPMGGTGGNGVDMSAAMAPCDVASQTGCPSGDKCIPAFGKGSGSSTCVAAGSVAEGQPCTPSTSNTTLNDNCAGGLICDDDGPGSVNVCRKICTADSGCSGSARCGSILYNVSYGICLPTCTAFGASCGAGNDCSSPFDDVSATNTTETGFFVCKKTGAGKEWAQCQQDSDCGANLACDPQAGCYPICDSSHACGDAPGDGGMMTCQPLVSQANGAGYCN